MNRRTAILVFSVGLAGASSAFAQAGFVGGYELQRWTSSGIDGGTTEIIPNSGPSATADFSYDVNLGNPGPGVSFRTVLFTNIAPASGNVSFDWEYNGMHAWFQADLIFEVFAETSAGRRVLEEISFGTPTGGGNFPTFFGTVTNWPIEEGMEWGLEIGGSNFDSTSILRGSLFITNFDAPAGGGGCPCACDFDTSMGLGICDLFDFLAFQGGFVGGEPCACDIDTSTGLGVCDLFDFLAFQGEFVSGCP